MANASLPDKNLLSELNWKSELTKDRKLLELKPSGLTSELKCGYTSGMKSGRFIGESWIKEKKICLERYTAKGLQ
ncbi:hypothetical protein AgCh_021487 [Apium graveolens]